MAETLRRPCEHWPLHPSSGDGCDVAARTWPDCPGGTDIEVSRIWWCETHAFMTVGEDKPCPFHSHPDDFGPCDSFSERLLSGRLNDA